MLTDRIHYKPGDTVTLTTRNACTLVSEIDNASTIRGSFIASGFGGFQITDSLTGASSTFAVSSNPLDTGVGGQLGSLGMTGDPKCLTAAAQLTANYQTVAEYVFFGPSDSMNLDWSTQPGGVGYSGQAHYPQSDANAIQAIADLHASGIVAVLYCNSAPCGPAGWAWAAVNPGLCIRDPFGNLDPPDPAVLAAWNSWSTAGSPSTGPLAGANIWQTVRVDWSQSGAIAQAVAALQRSVERYGFDAIRLDGFPDAPGNRAATIGNAVAMRQGMEGVALVGANFGRSFPNDTQAAIYISGGGLALTEAGGTWQDGLNINAQGGNWYTCNTPAYVFPSHPMYAQGTTPAINQWLLRWSGFLWDRSAYVVTTAPPVGTYVKTRRGADGLRYDVLFFCTPGTYTLPGTAYVTTPEGTAVNTATATIKSFGIAISKIDDRFPAGTVSVPCDHSSTGYNAPLGPDGRQYRPDLSTGTYPFLGFASVGPFPAGSYTPVFRVWYEHTAPGCELRLRIEDNASGREISVGYVHSSDVTPTGQTSTLIGQGWGYQDVSLPAFTLSQATSLQASLWQVEVSKGVNSGGGVHLDSVNFVPVSA